MMGKSTRIPAIRYLSTVFCAQYASSFQTISGVIDCQKSLQRNGRVRDEGSDTFLPPLWAEKYGRGAEIYPPTNQIEFTLADSFPNGLIPPIAQEALDKFAPLSSVEIEPTKDDKKDTKTSTTTDINTKRNVESKEITLENRTPFYKRILRLAAKSEEQSLIKLSTISWIKFEAVTIFFSQTAFSFGNHNGDIGPRATSPHLGISIYIWIPVPLIHASSGT